MTGAALVYSKLPIMRKNFGVRQALFKGGTQNEPATKRPARLNHHLDESLIWSRLLLDVRGWGNPCSGFPAALERVSA